MSSNKTIAVIFGSWGGLSDVGKYVALKALKENLNVRIMCMHANQEATEKDMEVDPGGKTSEANRKQQQEVKTTLESADVTRINALSDTAVSQIQEKLENVDAVVVCIGNRQPFMPRYMDIGMKRITEAMKAKEVKRLVVLSSFGIEGDYLPTSAIKVFWFVLFRGCWRSAYIDVRGMEKTIFESDLDYLIVRPLGIPPEEDETGQWLLYKSKEEGVGAKYKITIPKPDVATYMLGEVLEPSLHRTAVTIAGKPK